MATTGAPAATLWTIGHGTCEIDTFCQHLHRDGVQVLIDVRSSPYSKFAPQFNREVLAEALRNALAYEYLGHTLGGRPTDEALLLPDGKPDYTRMAEGPAFRAAIGALLARAMMERLCLMCAEEDPAFCHRTRLVAEALVAAGSQVMHLRHDGAAESHADVALRRAGGQLSLF